MDSPNCSDGGYCESNGDPYGNLKVLSDDKEESQKNNFPV